MSALADCKILYCFCVVFCICSCFRWHSIADTINKQWFGIVGLAIAFFYGSCSASMAFANKAVLTSYSFNYPFFLVTCQMAVSVVVLESLRLTGKTSLVPFTLSRGWMFLVPSVFYAANCVFALSALGGMNIPMYGLIKRTIPVAILSLGVFVLRKPLPSMPICLSVGMITLGCIIAGMHYFMYRSYFLALFVICIPESCSLFYLWFVLFPS